MSSPVLQKEDEDDLSELQLRLLALQSASRKWQQKEQQVLKESKEKITKAVKVPQDKSESACDRNKMSANRGNAVCRLQERARPAKPVPDKSRARKPAHLSKTHSRRHTDHIRHTALPHVSVDCSQAGVEETAAAHVETAAAETAGGAEEQAGGRGGEEEERGRDSEDQRPVQSGRAVQPLHEAGGLQTSLPQQGQTVQSSDGAACISAESDHCVTCAFLQSSDADQRKLVKQSLDTSGNLYQYDNYDEVAMDTDSETNSPGTGDE